MIKFTRPLVTILGIAATTALTLAPTLAVGATTDTWMPNAPAAVSGWQAEFVDNFSGSLNTSVWGRYDGGTPAGAVSAYTRANAAVDTSLQIGDGVLTLTSKKTGSTWTSAGLSSSPGFSASQGKWVIKAKFDRAPGIGYAFLLMPKGGGWPPEIDIAEGTAGGPHIMSTLHWGTSSNHQQIQRWLYGVDMTVWHTYGVTITSGRIDYTIDGRVWATVQSANVPTVPMWLGLQTGVKQCSASSGDCLSSATPTSSRIQVDWVAHYRKV